MALPFHFAQMTFFFNYIWAIIIQEGAWRKVMRTWGSGVDFPNHNASLQLTPSNFCVVSVTILLIQKVIVMILIAKATPEGQLANRWVFLWKTGKHEFPNSAVTQPRQVSGTRLEISYYLLLIYTTVNEGPSQMVLRGEIQVIDDYVSSCPHLVIILSLIRRLRFYVDILPQHTDSFYQASSQMIKSFPGKRCFQFLDSATASLLLCLLQLPRGAACQLCSTGSFSVSRGSAGRQHLLIGFYDKKVTYLVPQ